MLDEIKKSNYPFHICESGLFCVGGETIMPRYYKHLKSAYLSIKKALKNG